MNKTPFLTKEQAEEIAKSFPTPFHIYDEKAIRENARLVKKAHGSLASGEIIGVSDFRVFTPVECWKTGYIIIFDREDLSVRIDIPL